MVGNAEPVSTASISLAKIMPIDFHTLSPIYCIDEVSKNKHQLNIIQILNAILQMAYFKIYIPLSMLTTSALSKIELMMASSIIKSHLVMVWAGSLSMNPTSHQNILYPNLFFFRLTETG